MKKFRINNYVGTEEGLEKSKLFLYGDIGNYWEGDISAGLVQGELKNLNGQDIEIHINSYGGDLFEGIAIHNLIKSYSGHVTVVIDGLAASSASIIAMAGDEVMMPKNAQMLVHNPWTVALGNAQELRKTADDLEKAQESLEECYLEKFKGSREELRELLSMDMFLTANEAFDYGLCSKIIDPSDIESGDVSNSKQKTINKVSTKTKGTDEPSSDVVETPKEGREINSILKLFAKEKNQ